MKGQVAKGAHSFLEEVTALFQDKMKSLERKGFGYMGSSPGPRLIAV